MPACEKCWRDSARGPYSDHAEDYATLLRARTERGEACSPEDQAGPDATECQACQRVTVHQYAKVCTICGWRKTSDEKQPAVSI